jgi:structural maintenance of chromosome 3 (chondroitin sulfate proteoglycan 6)
MELNLNQNALSILQLCDVRDKARRLISNALQSNLFNTLVRVRQVLKERKVKGVYGILIELVSVHERFYACADIVGGLKLWAILVDSFETAQLVLDVNKEIKGSAIEVYALDMIQAVKVKKRKYPESQHALPLIKHIAPIPGFEHIQPILESIFNKALLVKNYETALKYAKSHNLTCVTIQCEVVYGGAFINRAGLYDITKEKISLYENLTKIQKEIEVAEENNTNLLKEKDKLKEEGIEWLRKSQENQNDLNRLNNEIKSCSSNTRQIESQIQSLQHQLEDHEKIESECGQRIITFESNCEGIKKMMEKDLEELSSEEEATLKSLQEQIMQKETEAKTTIEKKRRIELDVIGVKNRLENFILAKEQKLIAEIEDINLRKDSPDAADTGSNPAEPAEDIEELSKQLSKINLNIDQKVEELKEFKEDYIDIIAKSKEMEQIITKSNNKLEQELIQIDKINASFESAENALVEYESKLSSLNVSASSLNKYLEKDEEELFDLLIKKSKELSSFSNLQREVYDFYKKFKEKREIFTKRILEFGNSERDIKQLIENLDNEKDKAFTSTFQIIREKFKAIFGEIIPNGLAKLRLVKANKQQLESHSQKVFEIGKKKYTGIEIQVIFSPAEGIQNLHQLSGGQKSAVALSLILAIQHLEPAPLYILDEVDSALDHQYRINLANL